METDMRLVKGGKEKEKFLIIPVERKTITRFAIKNNEVKALGSKCVTLNEDVAKKYLYYFLNKYYEEDLIENKISRGHNDYKMKCEFEAEKKDNFYTLERLKLLKEEMSEKKELLEQNYNSTKLFKYKREVFKQTNEVDFVSNIDKVLNLYEDICNYFDELLKLDTNKYVISFINQ